VASETDSDAIQRSLADPAAFEVVFDRHYDLVRAYAQRRAGREDGEEIAASTFEIAFAERSRFRSERYTSARPWLIGIVNNLIRSHVRHEAVRRRHWPVSIALNASSPEPDLDRIEALERQPLLRSALTQISADDRDTFLLVVLAELSYADVSEVMDIPVGTVRSRVSRARGRLRELLTSDESISPGEQFELGAIDE
jgi:RNA polymerase sigma-70 factor (ECF subfamily)